MFTSLRRRNFEPWIDRHWKSNGINYQIWIEIDDANTDWILRILYSLFFLLSSFSLFNSIFQKKWKIFHAKRIPKTKNIPFGKKFTFLFFQEAFVFWKKRSPAIRKDKNIEKSYQVIIIVAWNRIYHRTRKKNRVSRRKGSSMNVSGQCANGWRVHVEHASERNEI